MARAGRAPPRRDLAGLALIDISRKTGLEFAIDIAPAAQQPALVIKRMRDSRPAHVHDDVSVVVASSRAA